MLFLSKRARDRRRRVELHSRSLKHAYAYSYNTQRGAYLIRCYLITILNLLLLPKHISPACARKHHTLSRVLWCARRSGAAVAHTQYVLGRRRRCRRRQRRTHGRWGIMQPGKRGPECAFKRRTALWFTWCERAPGVRVSAPLFGARSRGVARSASNYNYTGLCVHENVYIYVYH